VAASANNARHDINPKPSGSGVHSNANRRFNTNVRRRHHQVSSQQPGPSSGVDDDDSNYSHPPSSSPSPFPQQAHPIQDTDTVHSQYYQGQDLGTYPQDLDHNRRSSGSSHGNHVQQQVARRR
jgi:hypothetical protein